MKFKHLFTIGLSFLIIFSFCTTSQAYLQRLRFNVLTTNYTDYQQLNVFINIYDTLIKNPPDVIKSITVTAPDNTVFNLTTAQNWIQDSGMYIAAYRAEDFSSNEIPAGEYKVKVEGKQYNLVIEETDYVDATFLDPPVITSPTDGQTIGPTHLFTWMAVPGATSYRIFLWDEWRNRPVYWFWEKRFYTDHPACLLSLGDLRPDAYYRLRVEALAGSQDTDKRSRTDWIYFYTDHWE